MILPVAREVIQTASTSTEHFWITLLTFILGIGTILGWIWKFGSRLSERFDKVETGLIRVQEEQVRQGLAQEKMKRKFKQFQAETKREARAQQTERIRVGGSGA